MGQGFWGPVPLGRSGINCITRCPSLLSALRRSACRVASISGCSGLQWVLFSVSSAQKCSGAERLATSSGLSRAAWSAVSCHSPTSGHRASRSKYTRGLSRETGSLSRLPGGMGATAKCVSLGPAWADSGSISLSRRWRGSEDHCFQKKASEAVLIP